MLPRFKLEQNYDLIVNMKEMGLTDLFQEAGDFSEMTSEKVFMNWVSKTKSAMRQTSNIQSPGHLINCNKLVQNNRSLLIFLPS